MLKTKFLDYVGLNLHLVFFRSLTKTSSVVLLTLVYKNLMVFYNPSIVSTIYLVYTYAYNLYSFMIPTVYYNYIIHNPNIGGDSFQSIFNVRISSADIYIQFS